MKNDKNRSEHARMRAGLSLGQAAHFLGMDRDDLLRAETAETLDDVHAEKLADLYCVRVEWITGEVPQHDYAAVDVMKGAETLTREDRDALAKFAASMPRNVKSAGERLADAARRK